MPRERQCVLGTQECQLPNLASLAVQTGTSVEQAQTNQMQMKTRK